MKEIGPTFIAYLGISISVILAILKIRDSRKKLNVYLKYKRITFETERGEKLLKEIEVKIINKTNYNRSIQDIVFVVFKYYFFIRFKSRIIRFSSDESMSVTPFKPGEVRTIKYDLSYYNASRDEFNDSLFTHKERELDNPEQSLPPIPVKGCHPFRPKAATF